MEFCCRVFLQRGREKVGVSSKPDAESKTPTGGELPLGYIAWLLYSIVMSAKIGIIFGNQFFIVSKVDKNAFFDGSVLRTALSLSSIIFFTLILTHNDAPPKSEREVCNLCVFLCQMLLLLKTGPEHDLKLPTPSDFSIASRR